MQVYKECLEELKITKSYKLQKNILLWKELNIKPNILEQACQHIFNSNFYSRPLLC